MACWAMVTASSASYVQSVIEQTDINFSSQEVLDCAAIIGCNPPLLRESSALYPTLTAGYEYIVSRPSLCLESSYLYTMNVRPDQCAAKRSICQSFVFNYRNDYRIIPFWGEPNMGRPPVDKIPQYELILQNLIMNYGPVGVFVCSSAAYFKNWNPNKRPYILYQLGTSLCKCLVNHNMVAVGWTADYWILQNSWGYFKSTGEPGDFNVGRTPAQIFSASAFVLVPKLTTSQSLADD